MKGKTFGRLTVLSLDRKDERHRKFYQCRCSCGGEKIVQATLLRSGNTKSCGCMVADAAAARRVSLHHSEVTAVILGYKRHARDRGYPWRLSRKDVEKIIRKDCSYCGAPPSNVKITKNTIEPLTYSGIDRMDNDIGYEVGNCVPCCSVCNRAKQTMSVTEFAEWARRLAAMADQWGGQERLAA